MNQFDLSNPDLRDANLNTMEEWHPRFHAVKPSLDSLLEEYKNAMLQYKRVLLLNSDESADELKNHVTDEVNMWLLEKMDAIAGEVWSVREP